MAINKCDKPNFNRENVYRQLSEHNLLPEAWGGTTITVNCSATTGAGIKELLEMLALQAEMLELKANPTFPSPRNSDRIGNAQRPWRRRHLLVQNGTLRIGDSLVFDLHFAKVKTMHDENGQELQEAGPSTPVKITGFPGLPEAGSEFIIVKNEKEARELALGTSKDKNGHSSSADQKRWRRGITAAKSGQSEKKSPQLHFARRRTRISRSSETSF